jgi:hypothetical protein
MAGEGPRGAEWYRGFFDGLAAVEQALRGRLELDEMQAVVAEGLRIARVESAPGVLVAALVAELEGAEIGMAGPGVWAWEGRDARAYVAALARKHPFDTLHVDSVAEVKEAFEVGFALGRSGRKAPAELCSEVG